MPFHSMTNTIIFSGLLAVSVASAATYYVDAGHGDDKADGTSAATAWRSVARVNVQKFQPGDTVLFKRGDVFSRSSSRRLILMIPRNGRLAAKIFGGRRPIWPMASKSTVR